LKDEIEVESMPTYGSSDEGVHFRVFFQRASQNYDQAFEVASSSSDPLSGNGVSAQGVEVRPRGPNAFIEALPFEMLRTAHTNPQLIVSVEGLPAVCTAIDCDYTYL